MIISDKYRFAFVHIPKCAGTTVRNSLQQLDDRDGFYTRRVDQHAEIGLMDYVHIPLFELRNYFGSDFERIHDYWSFAVVRDPFARFPSSVSQRVRMYGDEPIQKQGVAAIKSAIDDSMEFLAKQPRHNHRLPAEYIHFQKQVDYIYLDAERIVDTLYMVDEVTTLIGDVGGHVGQELLADVGGDPARGNRAVVHRSDALQRLVETTRPVTRLFTGVLSEAARQSMRNMVYVPRDRRLSSLFNSGYVQDFIRDYYREDILLWNEVVRSKQESQERSV
jgi:hypothetical protein